MDAETADPSRALSELAALRAENAALTKALAEARLDAERATRAKDLFVSSVSHELRSPLSTMLMQAQILRSGDTAGLDLKKASEAIERATNRQVQLIDELLDVVRIVSGKLVLEELPANIAGVVRTALDTQRAPAEKKGVELRLDVDANTGHVSGDYARLQQVVRNVVGNAIKFSSKGNVVVVDLSPKDGRAVLQVKDSGAGIEASQLPHLFTRFTDPDAPRPKPVGGLGFGLAVSDTIVRRHGGTIAAASEGKGKGTVVTVTLPLVSPPSKQV